MYELSQVSEAEFFSSFAITVLYKNLYTHLLGFGAKIKAGASGGGGGQLAGQCPRSLSLKSAAAPVAATVSALIPLQLRCQLPASRGSGIKPGLAKASQRRPGGWGCSC